MTYTAHITENKKSLSTQYYNLKMSSHQSQSIFAVVTFQKKLLRIKTRINCCY